MTLDRRFMARRHTEIGPASEVMMANEGSYHENAARIGPETVPKSLYRGSYPTTLRPQMKLLRIQRRGARSLDNNLYIVAPNMGT